MSLSLVERIRSEMAGVNRWNADTRGTLLFECLEAFAARAEGDPAAEGDIPSIIERGQTGERLSPAEQSAWTGYELGWKDGLKHAISDLGECFECGHDLNGPYCPACNSDIDAARAEGVAAESKPTEMGGFVGDIFYGDPVHTTRGTHRWTGTEWRRLPSEVETLTELLAEARARVAALQQAGEPISRENLEAELRETIGLYVREAVTRMFSEENATYRCARQIAGMLQPGYYLHRKLFSSPLPQQTALVEEGVEKIIAPHEPAACGEGTLPSPSEAPLSAEEVELPNYWRAVVGDTYKPAVLRNVKHMHPTTVKEVFDRYAGTDVADVIAGLIFKNQIANNRSEFFAEEYAKATATPPPPTDGEVK